MEKGNKFIPFNEREYPINLDENSWEHLALAVVKAKKNGTRREKIDACLAATKRFNEVVNEERGTKGKFYGGFRCDNGRVVAFSNGSDTRMDAFILKYWPLESEEKEKKMV